ncbi:CocE/NonD family hydrolase [Leptospira sp. 96542]|nr:CocE/NonD family hydrolase [Leptospira sp. 96542]
MSAFTDAIQFLWNLQREKPGLPPESHFLGGSKKWETDIYRPKRKPKGTIVTINGLAPLGHKDPRFIQVNKAFAESGYIVVCPYFKDICEFKISKGNVNDISNFLEYLLEFKEKYSMTENVAVFAPSFSGGLSIIALTNENLNGKISSLMTIGAYSKVDELIKYLFENQETDEYGRMILLWNFMFLALGNKPKLKETIKVAILDNYYKNDPPTYWKIYNQLNSKDKSIFDSVKNSPKYRMDLWKKIVSKGGKHKKLLEELNVLSKVNLLKVPVTLIHGKYDDVVPNNQSQHIYDKLKLSGGSSKLCITTLLSHGDSGFKWSSLKEIKGLIVSFSFFFENIQIFGRAKV